MIAGHSTTGDDMPKISEVLSSGQLTTHHHHHHYYVNLSVNAKKPMLATPIKSKNISKYIEQPSDWVFEEKYDGERMLITYKNAKMPQIRQSRFLKTITAFQHNVTVARGFHDCVFDGELVFFDDKTERIVSICETGCRVKQLAAKYLIFDMQYCNGVDIRGRPLSERKATLKEAVCPTKYVQVSEFSEFSSHAELWEKFTNVCAEGGEGLMLKRKNQTYISDKRKWLKLKPLHLEGVREEYELFVHKLINDKNGIANILECGYYDETDLFIKVCSVSSGINGFVRGQLEQLADGQGSFRERHIVTLIADKTTLYKHLRHPVFKCLRFDLCGATSREIVNRKLMRAQPPQQQHSVTS